MIIYTATQQETKTLNINNVESTQSIVYINDIVIDDITLARGTEEHPNLRVLELNLNSSYAFNTTMILFSFIFVVSFLGPCIFYNSTLLHLGA